MFKHKVLITVIGVGLLFSGCSVSTLDVSYDDNTKTTTVDMGKDRKYLIPNSNKVKEKSTGASLNKASSKNQIFTSTEDCNYLSFFQFPKLEKNQYYYTFAKSDVYRKYKGSKCTTESFGDIEFHECGYRYVITYDEVSPNQGVLYGKRYLTIRNKKCFDNIKSLMK